MAAVRRSVGATAALRPRWLREVIGQKAVVQRLGIVLNACKKLKEPLAHILFDGPPGLGKTTFATVLPNELGTTIQMTSGPALTKPADLLPFLTNAEEGSILFIDEIHRMPRVVEEFIYPAMEDFRIDIVLGEGHQRPHHFDAAEALHADRGDHAQRHAVRPDARSLQDARAPGVLHRSRNWPRSSASTRASCRRDSADDAALEIARRSRGTPRIANARLWWARNFATSESDGTITLDSPGRRSPWPRSTARAWTSRIAAIWKR